MTHEYDLFTASTERAKHVVHGVAPERLGAVRGLVTQHELAILGLVHLFGMDTAGYQPSSALQELDSRFQTNLRRAATDIILRDETDEISLSWEELGVAEQQDFARQMLGQMQDMAGLVLRTKKSGTDTLTVTDIGNLKPYHKAEELRALLDNETYAGLFSVFDITRIYLRNKEPDALLERVAQAYEESGSLIDRYEFRELFSRRGEAGVTVEGIEEFSRQRDTLVEQFGVPRTVASVIETRYSTDETMRIRNITMSATALHLVAKNLRKEYSEEMTNTIINRHFGSYAISGSFLANINKITEVDELTTMAHQLAAHLQRAYISVDDNGITSIRSTSEFGNPLIGTSFATHRQRVLERIFDKSIEDDLVLQ